MKNLKKLREERHMTQKEVADSIGVSRPTVTRWENEDIYPPVTVIMRIANLLKCDIEFLLPKNVK